MPQILYNNIEFDSEEEVRFYQYLVELKDNGYVDLFSYQPDSYELSAPEIYDWKKQLKTKEKWMRSTLLQGHIYTPDFEVYWNAKASGIFYQSLAFGSKLKAPFICNGQRSVIEVKPSFDMNNMQRLFTINQKWMFQKHKIYVQKIVPYGPKKCLFAQTFVAEEAKYTLKARKLKKYKFPIKSLKQYEEEYHAEK